MHQFGPAKTHTPSLWRVTPLSFDCRGSHSCPFAVEGHISLCPLQRVTQVSIQYTRSDTCRLSKCFTNKYVLFCCS